MATPTPHLNPRIAAAVQRTHDITRRIETLTTQLRKANDTFADSASHMSIAFRRNLAAFSKRVNRADKELHHQAQTAARHLDILALELLTNVKE